MDMIYSAVSRCSNYAGAFRLEPPPPPPPPPPPRVAPQPWLSLEPRDPTPVRLASPSAVPSAPRKRSLDFHNLGRELESRPALSESANQGHIDATAHASRDDQCRRRHASAAAAGPGSTRGLARPRAQRGPARGGEKDERAWKRGVKVEKLEASSARQTHAVWTSDGSASIGAGIGNSGATGERTERLTPAGDPSPLDASRGDALETSKTSIVGGQHKSAFSPPKKLEHRRSTSSHFMVSELLKTTAAASALFSARGATAATAAAAAAAAAAHDRPAFVYAHCRASWPKPLVPRPIVRPSPPLPMPPVSGLGPPPQNWCAKCNVSFRLTSDLVYHMRSHHRCERAAEPQAKRRREERLRCQVCGESFRERHHLSRHMISHN